MNHRFRFTAVLLLIVVLMGGTGAARRIDYLVYSDSLDETAVIVDGTELTLRDLAFYILYEENLVEEEAFIYDPSDLSRYWKIHTNGTYIRLEAKEAAMNMAVHDQIFYELAQKEGVVLSEEEAAYAANTQADFWSDLKEGTLEKLGVSRQTLDESMGKIALAQKYQFLLAEINGVEASEYDVGGEKYQQLLKEHSYKIKADVWDRVHFGSITVDH